MRHSAASAAADGTRAFSPSALPSSRKNCCDDSRPEQRVIACVCPARQANTNLYATASETIAAHSQQQIARWRGNLFIAMSHIASAASDYYRIPPNRVIELGTQVQL